MEAFARKESGLSNSYVTDNTFDALLQGVFSRIVIKSDDIIKNGTASNIKINDEKSTISGNANFKLKDRVFGNFGLAGITKGKALSIFSSNAYSTGFTINGGIDFRTGGSIFYNTDTARLTRQGRQANTLIVLRKIRDVANRNLATITDSIRILESLLKLDNNSLASQVNVGRLDSNFTVLQSRLTYLLGQRSYYDSVMRLERDEIEDFVENTMSTYELSKIKTVPYTLHWLSFNGSFTNNGYNLFDTSVAAILKKDTVKREYYRQFSFNASYNYLRNTSRILFYAYGGFTVKNSYALEDISIKDNKLKNTTNKLIEINGEQLLDITKINITYNKPYAVYTFEFGGFTFLGKQKIIGFEWLASVSPKSNVPDGVEYRPSYNFRFGPLFSLSKSEGIQSGGTIGLMLTATNYYPNQTFGDVLSFGIRLGVPFNNIKL